MSDFNSTLKRMTRRRFLSSTGGALGAMAVGNLLSTDLAAASPAVTQSVNLPHFMPRAKRVIYLFQSGGPSHIDLFDCKEGMKELHGTELPDSIKGTQRVTGMTSLAGWIAVAANRCGL